MSTSGLLFYQPADGDGAKAVLDFGDQIIGQIHSRWRVRCIQTKEIWSIDEKSRLRRSWANGVVREGARRWRALEIGVPEKTGDKVLQTVETS